MKQGKATRDVAEGQPKGRPYAINPNYPSQLGSAIDPMAAEKMRLGPGQMPFGPTDGMEQGPGANRDCGPGKPISKSGSQGSY